MQSLQICGPTAAAYLLQQIARIESDPARKMIVEIACENCGGRGYELDDRWNEVACSTCFGTGRMEIERNYLAESIRIVTGASYLPPEREHLRAIIEYFAAAPAASPEVVA